jgi:alpha-glucoside transport system substrate-binding protein
MTIYDRQRRKDLDQLVEEYVHHNMVGRREFMRRAMTAGLSVSAASALLVACGGTPANNGTPAKVTSIDALTQWSGEELDSFTAINEAFTKKTGIAVKTESTRDMAATLSTRVKGNNPPDISGMPNTSTFQDFAHKGKLVALDSFVKMDEVKQNYAQGWIDLGSVDGKFYAVQPKANTKGTIWYNPKEFQAVNATIPATWDDLIALSDKIAASGKYPWSMGVESGPASGWPAVDWVSEIYINKYGPDKFQQWADHKIPWTDASIKDAISLFGKIVNGKHYINGAPQAILATGFQEASFAPFTSPPKAYMYYLGDFTAGFITAQFKTAQAGTDFNFFDFPTINPQFKGAVVAGTDLIAAFKDNDGTRQYMQYLLTAEAQTIWVKRGGATSVNKGVDLNLYPNDVARNAAKQMTEATSVKLSVGDLVPAAVQTAYWKGMVTYIGDPTQLDSVLSGIETIAQQAYGS